MRGSSDDFAKTAATAAAEATNFYKVTTADFYPDVLRYLESLTKGLAGGAAGALVGGVAGRIGGALMGGANGARFGPWGAAIGTIIGAVIPSLLDSDEDKNRFRKELDEATKTRKAVEEINERAKKPDEEVDRFSSAQYFKDSTNAISNIISSLRNSKSNQELEVLKSQNEELKKLNMSLRSLLATNF